jgi:hypothetical protein
MNLVRFVTAWFMQRDGKASINGTNNILRGDVRSIVMARAATTAHTAEKKLFWTAVLSGACAESVILHLCLPATIIEGAKIYDVNNILIKLVFYGMDHLFIR